MPETSGFPDIPDSARTATEPPPAFEPPPAEVARPVPPRNRPGLHLGLLLATFYTMTLAGALSEAGRLSLTQDQIGNWLINPQFLRMGLSYSLSLIAILGCHELGHYIACRYYGVNASLPYFLPSIPIPMGTFGAFIRIREPIPSRNALFDIGVAGPLAGFIVMIPVLVYGVATAQPVEIPAGGGYYSDDPLILTWVMRWVGAPVPDGYSIYLSGSLMAAWVGCLATAINLFPIGQLDGGHLCYAISARFHRGASLAGTAAFIAVGLLLSTTWLFFAALLLFFGPRHPPLIDETQELSGGRRLLAGIALIVLIVCFIPRPYYLVKP